MRIAFALALMASMTSAHADEMVGVKEKIAKCFFIPIESAVSPFTVTFEITVNKAEVQDVNVVEYQPHTEVMAKAVPLMVLFMKKCWPSGIKTSPHRLTYSLTKPLLLKPSSFPKSYEMVIR